MVTDPTVFAGGEFAGLFSVFDYSGPGGYLHEVRLAQGLTQAQSASPSTVGVV